MFQDKKKTAEKGHESTDKKGDFHDYEEDDEELWKDKKYHDKHKSKNWSEHFKHFSDFDW